MVHPNIHRPDASRRVFSIYVAEEVTTHPNVSRHPVYHVGPSVERWEMGICFSQYCVVMGTESIEGCMPSF